MRAGGGVNGDGPTRKTVTESCCACGVREVVAGAVAR